MTPPFFDEVVGAYRATTAHAFTLHGQGVTDYADESSIDLVPWLAQALVSLGYDLVIYYDLAQGITFSVPAMKRLFAELAGLIGDEAQAQTPMLASPTLATPQMKTLLKQQQAQAMQASKKVPDDVTLPSRPEQALPLIDRALALDPTYPGRYVTLGRDAAESAQGLYSTEDGGQTWTDHGAVSVNLRGLLAVEDVVLTWGSGGIWLTLAGPDDVPGDSHLGDWADAIGTVGVIGGVATLI